MPTLLLDLADAGRFPRKGRRSDRLGGFNHRKISIWPPKPWKNLDLTLPGITRLDHQNFDPGWIEPQDLDFDSKRWGKTRDRNGWNGPTLWLSHLGNRESSSIFVWRYMKNGCCWIPPVFAGEMSQQIPSPFVFFGQAARRHNDVFEFHMAPKIPPCSLSSDLEASAGVETAGLIRD